MSNKMRQTRGKANVSKMPPLLPFPEPALRKETVNKATKIDITDLDKTQ